MVTILKKLTELGEREEKGMGTIKEQEDWKRGQKEEEKESGKIVEGREGYGKTEERGLLNAYSETFAITPYTCVHNYYLSLYISDVIPNNTGKFSDLLPNLIFPLSLRVSNCHLTNES